MTLQEARTEREHWQVVADWLGDEWSLCGWDGTRGARFRGPDSRYYDIQDALAVRLVTEARAAAGS